MPQPARRIAADAAARSPVDALIATQRPAVIEGLARDWPLVAAGREGPQAAIAYLSGFYNGRPGVGYVGEPAIGGRFFYDEALTGMNFAAERTPLDAFMARMAEGLDREDTPAFYAGSTDAEGFFPGLRGANPLPLADQVAAMRPLVSVWIGTRTIASTHYDMSNNLAVCAVGRRRFTLFPPDQVANLYPGPLEPTPGGQVVSMVDLRAPDLERYPRFVQALEHAVVAELEPGDALIYPALWWHDVEALAPFNVLVNWWWNAAPAFMDTPMTTLMHGLLSLRDRPQSEKDAWREMFDYYVFGEPGRAAEHLPPAARGPLAPLDMAQARRLRAQLLNRLNR
ncbi:MAG: cupin-like domain-containing protein [Caulobacteraceae bacterium]|nr:cupin-like domain-containing protein [Caulobacter sp.]